jgi:hypothetical protein
LPALLLCSEALVIGFGSDPHKKEKSMNTRITLSAAIAAGVLFAFAPAQAQAPAADNTQKSQVKIEAMQSQINALQAQVRQLQQQLSQARSLAALSSPFTAPVYQMPDFDAPNVTLPNTQKPLVAPHAPRLYNIPDCQLIFIKQAAR